MDNLDNLEKFGIGRLCVVAGCIGLVIVALCGWAVVEIGEQIF